MCSSVSISWLQGPKKIHYDAGMSEEDACVKGWNFEGDGDE